MFERIHMAVPAVSPSRRRPFILPVLLTLLLSAATAGAAVLTPPAPQAAPSGQADVVPAHLSRPSLSLLPFLQVYIDTTGEMDVEEVAALPPDKHFVPLDVRRLPHVAGVTWLRFVLDAAAPGQENSAVLLDMGESVPGTPTLYNPLFDTLSNAVEWRENTPTSRNVLLLPKAGNEAQVCFLRLDGLPGLWFSPMLRTPHNAATDLTGLASKSALVALAVVMLLCLLRGLSEHGQWRIWTALYVAAALVQGYFGVPGNGAGHFSLEDAAALLTPGLALMFLPHVGRHLMQTRGRHRFLDVQFILLVLPGAALALLPLVPDMAWTARYLPLWPVGCLLCVPTATAACLMGLPGARRFLLGVLLPPAAVAAAVLGLDLGYAPSVLASLPLWGTALSALAITATAVPRQEEEEGEGEAPIELTMPAVEPGTLLLDDGPLRLDAPSSAERLPLLDDPNLRLLPSGGESIALPRMDEEMPPREEAPAPLRPEPSPAESSRPEAPAARPAPDRLDAERLEEALRRPLDDLMRETAVLEQCSLPPSARETARNMTSAARQMLAVLRDPASILPGISAPALQETFDLQELMRSVHDSVAAAAENDGIALAWYMPPYLPSFYSGEYRALDAVLRELLESAVRATRQGAVHFSVRRVPDSDDPGHLLFTVQDSGSGTPPAERSSLALSHVWELAGRCNGFLSAECGIRGATIAFTLHLEPVEGVSETPAAAATAPSGKTARRARILVCTPGAMDRQALVHMLDGLSCVVLQARTLPEALALHEQRPVTMLIAAGTQASVKAQETLDRFRQRATAAHLPVFGAIAVTEDDSQWDALAKAGFTHALLEPVDREALRQTVREILDAFFGSQGAESATHDEMPGEHPAGFPPLSGLLVRQTSAQPPSAQPLFGQAGDAVSGTTATAAAGEASAMSDEERTGDTPADSAPLTSAEERSATPDATPAPAVAADAAQDARPAIDNRWGEGAPSVTEAAEAAPPAADKDAKAADELPAIDNQWGAASDAAAADELPAIDNQWGRPAPVMGTPEETAAPAPADARSASPAQAEMSAAASDGEAVLNGDADQPEQAERIAPQCAPLEAETVAPASSVAAGDDDGATPVVPAAPVASATPDQMPRPAEAGSVTVGEPVPQTPPAAGDFLEWVGEPTPIPSSRPREAAGRASGRQAAAPETTSAGAADQPLTLTMQEALRAAEQEQRQTAPKAAPEAVARPASPATAATDAGPEGEDGAGVPSLLRRVLGRLQGHGESSATPAGPQSGRARAAEARRQAVSEAAPARSVTVREPVAGSTPPEGAPSGPVSVQAPAAAARPAQPQPGPVAPAPVHDGGTEAADQEMLDLVARFDAAVRKAQQAFANGNCPTVAVAAESIARDADAFGFRSLGRMARCVEQAGRHGDLGALRDLLPDLVSQVERNRIAIQKELR